MSKKKLSKTKLLEKRKYALLQDFHENLRACIHKGINISAECIINRSAWRIVINKVNKYGGIYDTLNSDDPSLKNPKVYTSELDYELKILELLAFYAGSSE